MALKEQYENMSNEELLERYTNYEDYTLEARIVILEELIKRGLKSEEEINQKLEKAKKEKKEKDRIVEDKIRKKIEIKDKIKKLLKKFLISICLVYIIFVAFSFVYRKLYPPIKKPVVAKRIYEGEYKGRIIEKYPDVTLKPEEVRLEILESIKDKKRRVHDKYKNRIVTEYFDNEGRIVFTSDEDQTNYKVESRMNKSSSKSYQLIMPIEEGFVYDEKGRVIKKVYISGSFPYNVREITEESRFTFLKQKSNGRGVRITEIEYLDNNRKKEVEEIISNSFQVYSRTERMYQDDIVQSEKTLDDCERDDGFIIATTEKKYNEKGELIYKTVERKDKTNDYKSFTEMDFAKDEIVTKYYKGNDVFATVTENLVGPVETIEETERGSMGEEIKKVYKNKVKAIVKRQKVGEPVKIVDIQTYDSKKREMNVERFIFADNGDLEYTVQGVPSNRLSYIDPDARNYPYSMVDGYLHESFYIANTKKGNFYKYFYSSKNLKKLDIKTNNIEFFEENQNEDEDTNISLGIINIEKFKLIKKEQIKEKNIKTLEELLNGYKHE